MAPRSTRAPRSARRDGPARLDGDALEAVARVVHEAVRAWAASGGDRSIPSWSRAPKWMKTSTYEAIRFRLANPDSPPAAQHDQWAAEKRAAGWRKGRVKDAAKKTHPLLVDYQALPLHERRKDALVGAVVDALTGRL
jgi:hypothetical protein